MIGLRSKFQCLEQHRAQLVHLDQLNLMIVMFVSLIK